MEMDTHYSFHEESEYVFLYIEASVWRSMHGIGREKSKPHTIQRCPSSALKVHEYYPTSMPFSLPCAKISESVVVFDGIKRVFGCSQWQKELGTFVS